MSEEFAVNQPAPKRRRAGWVSSLMMVGLALLGSAGGYAVARMALGANRAADGSRLISLPAALLTLPLVYFGAVLLHELGHVAGGRLSGFRFLLLIVGPLKVEGGARGLKLSFNRSWALAGGIAASAPLSNERIRPRVAAMVAGGPLASWLGGAGALGFASALPAGISFWPTFAAVTFGVCSLALGVVTLIPMQAKGLHSDGARLLSLWRGSGDVEHWLATLVITSQSLTGVRPRDWDAALVERAATLDTTPFNLATGNLSAYYRALDRGELEPARRFLARAFEQRAAWPEAFQPAIVLEAAFWAARYDADAERAAHILALAPNPAFNRHTLLRAEAALALLRGDRAAALALVEQALAAVERESDRGLVAAQRDWLGQIRAEAQD